MIGDLWFRRRAAHWVQSSGPHSLGPRMFVTALAKRAGVTVHIEETCVRLRRGYEEFLLPHQQFALTPYVAANFDLFFSAVEPDWVDGKVKVVDFSEPRLHRLVKPPIAIETAGFPDRLDFEAEYFHWYTPGAGDFVWDLGANVGIATMQLASLVGEKGRVLAVEPDPENFRYLKRNLEVAGIDNVLALNAAVSDEDGFAEFYAEGTMFAGLATVRREAVFQHSLGQIVNVPTRSLDSLAQEYFRPDFVKMDIEGAEIEALSACGFALEHLPAIACETNHFRGRQRTQAAVEEKLWSLGYEVKTDRPLGSFITWGRSPAGADDRLP